MRFVYKDHSSSFDELLEKDISCKIHDRNLQNLVTETFKVKMNLAPEIMKEVFKIAEFPYALRNELKLETASFVGARVWNSLPSDLKESKSLEIFKSKIKNWIPKNCLANFVNLTSNELAACKLRTKSLIIHYDFFS